MRLNKTNSDCTIYAMTGTAILAISLVVAVYVGNDFHQSLFVELITFVGSNILPQFGITFGLSIADTPL